MDPEIDFAAMFADYDALLMGRKTFTQMNAMGQGATIPCVATYVFSATLRQQDHPDVTIVADRASEVVKRLRDQPGKDIALFGGGELFRSLLDAGLVDTVEVALVPVLLGAGVPLMAGPHKTVGLRLTKQRVLKTSGTLMLEYCIGPAMKEQ
jgi:dihydrofolate reductase